MFFLPALAVNITSGQTIHDVTPGSRGNTIELTIANNTGRPLVDIHVGIAEHSKHLTFTSSGQPIQSMLPAQDTVVTLTFDVARSAPVNTQDILEFQIADNRGVILTKSIIVRYPGPATFGLDQNFPNPFNPSTTIRYQLPVPSHVNLVVFDILGREVARLVNEDQLAGFYDITWAAHMMASGVYFYRLTADKFAVIRKMLVTK
jgi:hypothetical protein